jgi:hypothetical protein
MHYRECFRLGLKLKALWEKDTGTGMVPVLNINDNTDTGSF